MTTNSQITGATMPLFISGKEFAACTLSDKDHDELDNWVQSEYMKIVRKTLTPDLTPDERKEQLEAGLNACFGLHWASMEAIRVASTLRGIARLAWQMTRKSQKLNFEDFLNFFSKDPETERFLSKEKIQENIDATDEVYLILNSDSKKVGETVVESEEDSTSGPKSN